MTRRDRRVSSTAVASSRPVFFLVLLPPPTLRADDDGRGVAPVAADWPSADSDAEHRDEPAVDPPAPPCFLAFLRIMDIMFCRGRRLLTASLTRKDPIVVLLVFIPAPPPLLSPS